VGGQRITGSPVWNRAQRDLRVFDEGNGPLSCAYDPDTGVDVYPGTLLPGPDCYQPDNFNDKVVMIAHDYGVATRRQPLYNHYRCQDHRAAFDLPYLGHAADPSTRRWHRCWSRTNDSRQAYLMVAAPTLQATSSCEPVPPEHPIARSACQPAPADPAREAMTPSSVIT